MRAFKRKIDLAVKTASDAAENVGHLNTQFEQLGRDLEDISVGTSVPTPAIVLSARAVRDGSWSRIREDTTAKRQSPSDSLDEFERLVNSADGLVDRRIEGVDLLARQRHAEIERVRVDESLKKARDLHANATAARETVEKSWSDLWTTTAIEGQIDTPEVMLEWLDKKDKVLEALEAVREIESEYDAAHSKYADARAHLVRAGELVDAIVSESESADAAEQRVSFAITRATERWTKAGELQKAISRRGKEFELANAALVSAGDRLADWARRWAEHMPAVNLGLDATPSEATTLVALWEAFAKEVDKVADTKRLLKGIREELKEQEAAGDAVVSALGPETTLTLNVSGEWHAWPAILFVELQKALASAQKIEKAEQELSGAVKDAGDARDELRLANEACDRLRGEVNFSKDDDIGVAITQSARKRTLSKDIESEARKLLEAAEDIGESQLRVELVTLVAINCDNP